MYVTTRYIDVLVLIGHLHNELHGRMVTKSV